MITCPLCERLWKLSRKLLSLVIGHRTQVFDSHDAGPLSQTGHVFTQSLILRPIRPVSRPFFGHTRAYTHTHTRTHSYERLNFSSLQPPTPSSPSLSHSNRCETRERGRRTGFYHVQQADARVDGKFSRQIPCFEGVENSV